MNAGVPDETWWRHERDFAKSETASENEELFEKKKVPEVEKVLEGVIKERAVGRPGGKGRSTVG